jgi:sporulation protein YlmC with PRC-barrel domain
MNKKFLTVSIVAVALVAGSQNLRADHLGKPHSEKSANNIIGQKVTNDQNEDLGKVQDLIINVESGQAPYAIIATGGLTKRTKVAVPLSSLHCSTDGKSMVISATKEQLQAASKTPSGAWTAAADSDWAKKVDGYYGQPMAERSFRDRIGDAFRNTTNDARTYVRDPAPKGAELLMTPQDSALCQKIAEKTDVCNIQVQNGVAHLYGQVENEEARQKLENQVRSVEGVTKVESHLRIKNQ